MKLKPETIQEETQRESIVNRPHNLAGSIKRMKKERFSIKPDKIELTQSNTVPALLKLFMESLDNPIDVAIKGGCSKIKIDVTPDTIKVQDDGYGISTDKDENGEYILYKAMCKYNTSSNYQEGVKGQGQKGVNGIGIKLCTTLSTWFRATSDDGSKRVQITATDNNLNHDAKELAKSSCTGMTVEFKPDFKIFEGTKIDQEHIDRMFEYTLIQALTYPDIQFKFNGKLVKYTPKKFLDLFNKSSVVDTCDDYFFAFFNNELDDFRQISFVNGLETSKGGSHIDYVVNNIVNGIRAKLIKKYKTIKPGDIKNKLQFVLIAKNMKNIDWDGQTKESISSTPTSMRDYFKGIDVDSVVKRIMKTPDIIDAITEVYKIKEEFAKRKELKGLEKPTKKIKSEKYLPATGVKKYLMITEGASATGGLMPVMGRETVGYYELKGKPLNAIKATQSEFVNNPELAELYKIIKHEGYQYIIPATDQDLDGFHIRGLLFGFIMKYLPEFKDKIGILNTPVIGIKKAKKLQRWYYSMNDAVKILSGEVSKYYKGLGSWKETDLKHIVNTDGIDKMIEMIEFDNDEIILDWLHKDRSDKRKEYIKANNFSISKA